MGRLLEENTKISMMNQVYDYLSHRARSLQLSASSQSDVEPPRILIALAGPPGSGKSTIAAEVVDGLNDSTGNGRAIVLPMDGFHLTRTSLSTMSNSEEAFARRGVHWTYNAKGVFQLVKALHETRTDRSVVHLAPCFDHATKDPVEDAIKITPEISLVIIEGNWLLFDEEPWSNISKLVDDTWFVDVDESLALTRVAKRHLHSGIESCWDDAIQRAKYNDMVNGDLVRTKLIKPAVEVQSIDTPISTF